MSVCHKVHVRVVQKDGVKTEVLKAKEQRMRRRLLRCLFGAEMNVLIISPGNTVNAIEIKEEKEGGVNP